jgi:hypothetical protein
MTTMTLVFRSVGFFFVGIDYLSLSPEAMCALIHLMMHIVCPHWGMLQDGKAKSFAAKDDLCRGRPASRSMTNDSRPLVRVNGDAPPADGSVEKRPQGQ